MSSLYSDAPAGIPLWSILKSRDEFGGDLPLLTVVSDLGVGLRNLSEGRSPSEDLDRYRVVRSGDLVVNKLWARFGAYGVSEVDGLISPAYWVLTIAPGIEPRYLHYLLRSSPYRAEIWRQSKDMPPNGFDLPWAQFRSIRIQVPPLREQRSIAGHLDAETSRIDELVAARRHQVDLLVARRAALISRCVETGRPTPVRRVISLCTSGPRGWGDLVTDAGTMFIRSANLTRTSIRISSAHLAYVPPQSSAEATRSRVRKGDVLVGITGANTGWVGLAGMEHEGAYVSQHVAILRPDGVLPEWLAYSVASEQGQRSLLASQYGGTKTQLGLDDLRELVIRVPHVDEQAAATTLVSKAETDTVATLNALQRGIDLLLERRQAVTTAAVTGELQIPKVTA